MMQRDYIPNRRDAQLLMILGSPLYPWREAERRIYRRVFDEGCCPLYLYHPGACNPHRIDMYRSTGAHQMEEVGEMSWPCLFWDGPEQLFLDILRTLQIFYKGRDVIFWHEK